MILHLSTLLNQFAFVSSGFEALFHLSSRGGTARLLRNQSPLLGSAPNTNFFSTTDNWNPGDTLVIHPFNSLTMEALTLETINQNKQLSPDKLASLLLSTLQTTSPEATQKVVLSLLRIF